MAVTGIVRIFQMLSVLKNRVQARTAANFKLRIALLLAFSVANVVVGGLIYGWLTPEEEWGSSLFTVYAVLFSIPGADITHAPTPLATFLLNIIFIFGLLVFATILAMITEEVNSLLLAARSGRAPLTMTGHILLLGWNKQVSFILDQLEQVQLSHRHCHAHDHHHRGHQHRHPFAGRPVVILANKDKEEMDKLVVSFMRQHQLEIHTRTGKPYILDHLRRVSASEASAVLVLHQSDSAAGDGGGSCGDASAETSALKVQTILALSSLLRDKQATVVVQVPESHRSCSSPFPQSTPAAAAGAASGGNSPQPALLSSCPLEVLDAVLSHGGHSTHLMELPVTRIVNSLAVQTAVQPWVATIYQQILQQGLGPNITCVQMPHDLFGETHKEKDTQRDQTWNDIYSSSSSFSSSVSCKGYSSSFLGSFSAGSLFRRPTAACSSGNTDAPVAAVPAASMAAKAAAEEATSAAATDGSVPYEEVRVRFSSAMLLIGFYRHNHQQLVLNPADDDRLGPGDVLVALTHVHKVGPGVWSNMWTCAAAVCEMILSLLLTAGSSGGSSSSSNGTGMVDGAGHTSDQQQQMTPSTAAAGSQTQLVPAANQVDSNDYQVEECAAAAAAAAGAAAGAGAAGAAAAGAGMSDTGSGGVLFDEEVQELLHGRNNTKHMQQQQQHQQQQLLPSTVHQAAVPCSSSGHDPWGGAIYSSTYSGGGVLLRKLQNLTRQLSSRPHIQKQQHDDAETTEEAAVEDSRQGEGDVANVTSTTTGSSSSSSSSTGPGLVQSFSQGLRASWRFGASKLLQQHNRTLARQRISKSKSSLSAAAAAAAGQQPDPHQQQQQQWSHRPLKVLVVGYTATEAAEHLLPQFLDFAPPGSVITVAVDSKHTTTTTSSSSSSRFHRCNSSTAPSVTAAGSSDDLDADAASAAAGGVCFGGVGGDWLPAGYLSEGVLEESEVREHNTPLLHKITYRFLPVANPTSCEGLAAAGLLAADAVLLTAAAAARGSSSEADAHVLGMLISIQHLLAMAHTVHTANNSYDNVVTMQSNSLHDNNYAGAGDEPEHQQMAPVTSFASRAAQMKKASLKRKEIVSQVMDVPAAVAAAAAAMVDAPAGSSDDGERDQEQQQQTATGHSDWQHSGRLVVNNTQQQSAAVQKPSTAGPLQQQQQQQQCKRPHVVACVSTTAAKAVADAFFGAADVAAGAGVSGSSVAGSSIAVAGSSSSSSGSGCLFSYELIVPGEVESAVLVQVAQQPLYSKVILELLGSSEGCELYLLDPATCGFVPGEVAMFAEVQEAGRLMSRTVIGVITGGHVVLVPGGEWQWVVQEGDKVAAIAVSW